MGLKNSSIWFNLTNLYKNLYNNLYDLKYADGVILSIRMQNKNKKTLTARMIRAGIVVLYSEKI